MAAKEKRVNLTERVAIIATEKCGIYYKAGQEYLVQKELANHFVKQGIATLKK